MIEIILVVVLKDQNEQDSRISDVNQRRDNDRRKLFDAMTQSIDVDLLELMIG